MDLISCKDLSIGYGGNLAVKEATFNVSEGDYLCILGENGSGKSTLINGLLGLISKKSGEINLNGIHKNEIGYLPQQTQVQKDFPASVFEVVLSGCLNSRGLRPFYSKKEKQRAMDNIKLFKIDSILKKSYRDLSGGQQQRVLLARALCATRKLLILDEPVTGLDPTAINEFYSIVKDLNNSTGITIIVVSHDISNAIKYSNKVLHMDSSIKFFGDTKDYVKTNIYKKIVGGDIND